VIKSETQNHPERGIGIVYCVYSNGTFRVEYEREGKYGPYTADGRASSLYPPNIIKINKYNLKKEKI
jgi:hypothetical protein